MGEGSGGGIEIGCFVEGVDFSREKDRERWGRSFVECVNPVKWPGNEESIDRGSGGWSKLPRQRSRLAQSEKLSGLGP